MPKISTKELIDEYFENVKGDMAEGTIPRVKPSVDRPELYEYEKKIGKQLVEMTPEEILDMFIYFEKSRNTSTMNTSITFASVYTRISHYRNIVNYYIDNYEIIKNPFNDKKLKGKNVIDYLNSKVEGLSPKDVERAIEAINNAFIDYRRDYYECVVRLFFEGVASPQEMVEIKKEHIDFKTREIRINNKVIKLSERCFELFLRQHNTTQVEAWRGYYEAIPYHDSFIKFYVRAFSVPTFDDLPTHQVLSIISKIITKVIRHDLHVDIKSYREIYWLGFYKFFVDNVGEEKAKECINSVRDSESTAIIMEWAQKYGVSVRNQTQVKEMLRRFV